MYFKITYNKMALFFSMQAQFFPPSKFCWYNMFNHFFFGSHVNEETFQTFLRKEGLLMVMDPPFGGLAEVLADSIKTIWNIWRKAFSFGKLTGVIFTVGSLD